MQNSKSRGIMMGATLLGASAVLGTVQVGFAAPNRAVRQERREVKQERREVKQARKEVKQQRKDVRKADTARERRQEQRELRDAQQDLRRERRDVQRERQEARQPNFQTRRNYNYRPAPNFGGNWNNRPNYNYATNVDFTGVILDSTDSGTFRVRATNGQVFTVRSDGATRRGQRVRVMGQLRNGVVFATDVDAA